ncbi:MAG: hypothetical protein ACLT8E_09835 [Akkermansia sp.]
MVKEPFHLERVLTDLSFMHGEGLHFDELPERYDDDSGLFPSHPYKRWPVEISAPWPGAWRKGAFPPS